MAVLIGEIRVRFYNGAKFKFERVGKREWRCIHQDWSIIPETIIEEINENLNGDWD